MKTKVNVLPYMLADSGMMSTPSDRVLVWNVSGPCVVIGQSNRMTDSLDMKKILRDHVPVYRRPSGGQPVLLTPRTVQVTVAFTESTLTNPLKHFRRINDFIMILLERLLGIDLRQRGISDLATEADRKVMGSSMYRSAGRILYQGVLNVSEDPGSIARYLLHPPQEPEYRRGRDHRLFVTSLSEIVPKIDERSFFRDFKRRMEDDFLSVASN